MQQLVADLRMAEPGNVDGDEVSCSASCDHLGSKSG
jgi:hypothetical protein